MKRLISLILLVIPVWAFGAAVNLSLDSQDRLHAFMSGESASVLYHALVVKAEILSDRTEKAFSTFDNYFTIKCQQTQPSQTALCDVSADLDDTPHLVDYFIDNGYVRLEIRYQRATQLYQVLDVPVETTPSLEMKKFTTEDNKLSINCRYFLTGNMGATHSCSLIFNKYP